MDKNDPSDLKKHISLLQSYRRKRLKALGYAPAKLSTSRGSLDYFMPLIADIMDADISSCYCDTDLASDYYVYIHCNPLETLDIRRDVREVFLASRFGLKFKPFYVGKGTGGRYLDFSRNDSYRKLRSKILSQDKEVIPVKIAERLPEAKALALEAKLIDILGLKIFTSGGYLVNLDEGAEARKRRNLYPASSRKILNLNGFKGV